MKKATFLIIPVILFCLTYAKAEDVNLFKNPGFETVSGTSVTNWDAYGGWGGKYVSLSKDNPFSGSNCALLTPDSDYSYPYVGQVVTNILPNASYRVSAMVRTSAPVDSIFFKITYWSYQSGKRVCLLDNASDSMAVVPNGAWQYVYQDIQAMEGCTEISILLRMGGSSGAVYYDNASFIMTAPPPYILSLNTDEVFYYSDMQNGVATVKLNDYYSSDIVNAKADFTIKYQNTVISLAQNVPSSSNAVNYTFDTRNMVLKNEYTLEVDLKSSNGTLLEKKSQYIYRYDRPSIMREDGLIYFNNEPFHPIFAYHVSSNAMPYCKQGGINVVQGGGGNDVATLKNQLDTAHSYGLKVLMPLYYGMKPAGHPDKIDITKQIVEQLQTHPALLGWIIMDEPFYHDPDGEDFLRISYKTVRDIDSVHPVFIMEDSKYEISYKYADILGIDPYPASIQGSNIATYVYELTERAAKATNGRKPVYALLQAFEWNGYFPSSDELSSMIYQAFYAGAKAIGYYCVDGSVGTTPLYNTPLWKTIVGFYENEVEYVRDAFVLGKYTLLQDYKQSNIWAKRFDMGDSYYEVILNLTGNDLVANVPSSLQIITPIEVVLGNDGGVCIENGALNATITPYGVGIYNVIASPNRAIYLCRNNIIQRKLTNGEYVVNGYLSEGAKAYVIAALYKNNELIDTPIFKNITLTNGRFLENFSITNTENITLKVFVIDIKESMVPLTKAAVLQ